MYLYDFLRKTIKKFFDLQATTIGIETFYFINEYVGLAKKVLFYSNT